MRPTATVIGGGLGGTSMAAALQRRGFRVTIIEKNAALACEASGQPAGILQPILHRELTKKMQLGIIGFLHTSQQIQTLTENEKYPIRQKKCGVLQLAPNEAMLERFQHGSRILETNGIPCSFSKNEKILAEHCGLVSSRGGVFFEQGAWLAPSDLCKVWIQHPNIHVKYNSQACHFKYDKNKQEWSVYDTAKQLLNKSQYLILCSALQTKNFKDIGLEWLPLRHVRGQTFNVTAPKLSQKLCCIVSYDGYIIPKLDSKGTCLVGATFEEWNHQKTSDPEQNKYLLKKLFSYLPETEKLLTKQISTLSTRVGFRTNTPDRLPLCGPLNIAEMTSPEIMGEAPQLYMATAYGSHGLLFAPLGAEIVASQICKEKTKIAKQDLIEAISPARYFKM